MLQDYSCTIIQVFVVIYLTSIINCVPGPDFLKPFPPPKTKTEQECYEKVLLAFGGNKIGASCMEYAILHLTLFTKKLLMNKYALDYYWDLKQHLRNGTVKSPQQFCAEDIDNKRLKLLEPIFGKSVDDAVKKAYFLNEIAVDDKAKSDVIYDYMVHISVWSSSDEYVFTTEREKICYENIVSVFGDEEFIGCLKFALIHFRHKMVQPEGNEYAVLYYGYLLNIFEFDKEYYSMQLFSRNITDTGAVQYHVEPTLINECKIKGKAYGPRKYCRKEFGIKKSKKN